MRVMPVHLTKQLGNFGRGDEIPSSTEYIFVDVIACLRVSKHFLQVQMVRGLGPFTPASWL